jgi:hypothetical protein
MKKQLKLMGLVGGSVLLGISQVYAQSTDAWGAATTAVTTAGTNVVALLVVAVSIPIAFMGYRFVKQAIRHA